MTLFIIFSFVEATRHVRLWNILMAGELVEQYGREEVRVITDAIVPRRRNGDIVAHLFKPGSKTC